MAGRRGAWRSQARVALLVLVLALPGALAMSPVPSTTVTLVNGGFEDGTLTGWQHSGASVVTTHGGNAARFGKRFAVLTSPCGSRVLRQDYVAEAGETLSGSAFFGSASDPRLGHSGLVRVLDGGGTTRFAVNVGHARTAWRDWTFTTPRRGPYTIEVIAVTRSCGRGQSIVAVDIAPPPPDVTPPKIAVKHVVDGEAGWNVTDGVQLLVAASDDSGAAPAVVCADEDGSVDDLHVVRGDGVHDVTCTATDAAGNTSSAKDTVWIDTSPPDLVITGARAYLIDEHITIDCTAHDAGSGGAEASCERVDEPATTFGPGTFAVEASAVDRAGNAAAASAGWSVTVTRGSLCSVVERVVSHDGVAHALCAKLRKGPVKAFERQVRAQSGKKIAEADAEMLIAFSAEIR